MKRLLLLALSISLMGAGFAQSADKLEQTASKFVGGRLLDRVVEYPSIGCYNVDGGGFVIVSDNDRAPVLGYAREGKMDTASMPPAFKAWIEELAAIFDAHASIRMPSAAKDLPGKVDPLLTSEWTQSGNGYNDLTPTESGDGWGHPTVGCAALAMGQVMRYWRYPQHGMGSTTYSHEGQYECWRYGTLTVDYEDHDYDWDQMPNALGYGSSQAERDAVSTLLYDCGVSLKMLYNIDCYGSSGAEEYSQITALKEVFGYNSDAFLARRADYTSEEWDAMMKTELAEGRPILFAGYCTDDQGNPTAGHAFVLDGYDSEGLYHVNWGWGGSHDGYYALAILNPIEGYSFSMSQTAIIGLDTNQGHSPVVRLASNLDFANNHIDSTGHIEGYYRLTNSGDAAFDGYVGIAVYDTLTEDDQYRNFYRYFDTREVHLAVGDTLDIRIDCHEAFEVGRYHFCLHYGSQDFSTDTQLGRSKRMFDACYDFERRILVDQPYVLGVDEMERLPLALFPNPATDYIVAETNPQDELVITDMMGREVLHQQALGNSTRLSVGALPKGIYLIKSGSKIARLIKR